FIPKKPIDGGDHPPSAPEIAVLILGEYFAGPVDFVGQPATSGAPRCFFRTVFPRTVTGHVKAHWSNPSQNVDDGSRFLGPIKGNE
ncbi:MAG: hypothetical protein KJO15_18200, partial [Alphaproteobacteria bacterium]|nr:hypothetical protein [Alphaproteobacteria bacterium]